MKKIDRNHRAVTLRNASGALLLCAVSASGIALAAAAESPHRPAPTARLAAVEWGTPVRPFAASSLWNSRPVDPVLGDFVIPKSQYFPSVGPGPYSLSVFVSKPIDVPMTVMGAAGKGIWDPDAEAFRAAVTIPRWPFDVVAATGSDGHADIVDPISGIVHSFFQLRQEQGRWVAKQYAWTALAGRGWGDPAHYFQGARAAGVASMGGLIRTHEIDDGDTMYRHALATSLTFNALAAKPAYVFPATSADSTAATANSGRIPEGALLMLPADFDTRQMRHPALRKVAETLKAYGAYVVDRNYGTPFYIYVENGSGFTLHAGGWNAAAATDLDKIRQALRQVVSAREWVDGNGQPFVPERNLNLLSMRGPWQLQSGATPGVFDTWEQAVVFRSSAANTVQVNTTARGLNAVDWALPAGGATYRLTAVTTGGARLRLQVRNGSPGGAHFDSGELAHGESVTFEWPAVRGAVSVYAISGGTQVSTVRGELVAVSR